MNLKHHLRSLTWDGLVSALAANAFENASKEPKAAVADVNRLCRTYPAYGDVYRSWKVFHDSGESRVTEERLDAMLGLLGAMIRVAEKGSPSRAGAMSQRFRAKVHRRKLS